MINLLLLVLVIAGVIGLAWWGATSRRRLARDLALWRKKGWISEQAVRAILSERRRRDQSWGLDMSLGDRLVALVSLLGILLLLFAALSFVAANWQEMSRLARLTWLIVALWAAYLSAWRLHINGHGVLFELTSLLGLGMFGLNIVFIAQMYHIDSHPPTGILIWTGGALITAALTGSRLALFLSFIGAVLWSLIEITGFGVVFHWPFLIVWGAALALSVWIRWEPAYHPALLTFVVWLVFSLTRYGMQANWPPQGILVILVMVCVLLLALSFVLQENNGDVPLEGFEGWLELYAVTGLTGTLFALQTIELKTAALSTPFDALAMVWLPVSLIIGVLALIFLIATWREDLIEGDDLAVIAMLAVLALLFSLLAPLQLVPKALYDFISTWMFGALFLLYTIWLMIFGHQRHRDFYILVALIAFGAEVLYVYNRVFGSLLETSLFFLVGGVLTLALALLLYQIYQQFEDDTASGGKTHEGIRR